MKKSAIILILAWISISINAQIAPQKYFIEFMDKTNSPYSITRPNEFLSQRAIERRQKQGIPIVTNDIPVNQSYVTQIMQKGVQVLTRSKWMNGITVYCLNSAIMDSILQLPFVKRIFKNEFYDNVSNYNPVNKFELNEVSLYMEPYVQNLAGANYIGNSKLDYGAGYNQIHMLHGDSLHAMGFRGEGMIIAVLDAGFFHVDILPAFDSLRINNQIIATRDFVIPGNNVYNEYEHGMEVLSCMGSNLPGQLVGTAPHANYLLLRTEDAGSEYLIEEYNWVSAAEYADSAGADIINSSLGYTEFNDATQNHTCAEMNGHTPIVAKGANLAFSKGMFVVNSAGNYGTSGWKCVSSPADGFGVMAVAAVCSKGLRADFSSVGSNTGRVKPQFAAMGRRAVVSSTIWTIMYNNGTSFSSPILAGLVACLWQSQPGWSNKLVFRSIELSGHQSAHPDSLLGYGIPDFIRARQVMDVGNKRGGDLGAVYPNPFTDQLSIALRASRAQNADVSLFNSLGIRVRFIRGIHMRAGENEILLPGLRDLPAGNYILQITGPDLLINSQVIRICLQM